MADLALVLFIASIVRKTFLFLLEIKLENQISVYLIMSLIWSDYIVEAYWHIIALYDKKYICLSSSACKHN